MKPAQIVEAILFASDAPLQAEEIARADQALDEDVVERAIRDLQHDYDDGERAYQIREVGGGFQIMTRPEYAPYLERFDTVPRPSRLSGPALETLAIIAYRQPIGRVEIEYIRGVGSSGVIRTLQERGLVEVVGRGEGLGRPLLYGTGARFLEHFGFKSAEELPRPEELPIVLRDRTPLGLDDDEDEEDDLQETLALDGDGAVAPTLAESDEPHGVSQPDAPEFRPRAAELDVERSLPLNDVPSEPDPERGSTGTNGGGLGAISSPGSDAGSMRSGDGEPADPWAEPEAELSREDRHD